eukprot:jgi/Undpi1/1417/HiC_scaffold_11.g04808.m1
MDRLVASKIEMKRLGGGRMMMDSRREDTPGVAQLREEVAALRGDVDHIRSAMQDMHREVGSAVLLLSRFVGLEWDTGEAVRLAEKRSASARDAVERLSNDVGNLEQRLTIAGGPRPRPENGGSGGGPTSETVKGDSGGGGDTSETDEDSLGEAILSSTDRRDSGGPPGSSGSGENQSLQSDRPRGSRDRDRLHLPNPLSQNQHESPRCQNDGSKDEILAPVTAAVEADHHGKDAAAGGVGAGGHHLDDGLRCSGNQESSSISPDFGEEGVLLTRRPSAGRIDVRDAEVGRLASVGQGVAEAKDHDQEQEKRLEGEEGEDGQEAKNDKEEDDESAGGGEKDEEENDMHDEEKEEEEEERKKDGETHTTKNASRKPGPMSLARTGGPFSGKHGDTQRAGARHPLVGNTSSGEDESGSSGSRRRGEDYASRELRTSEGGREDRGGRSMPQDDRRAETSGSWTSRTSDSQSSDQSVTSTPRSSRARNDPSREVAVSGRPSRAAAAVAAAVLVASSDKAAACESIPNEDNEGSIVESCEAIIHSGGRGSQQQLASRTTAEDGVSTAERPVELQGRSDIPSSSGDEDINPILTLRLPTPLEARRRERAEQEESSGDEASHTSRSRSRKDAAVVAAAAAAGSTEASAQSGLASSGDGESQECAVLRFDGDSPDSDASS